MNKKLKIITEHKPVSVCINSNVPGYETPIFICNDNTEQLIDDFVNTIHEISLKAESINKQKYFHIIEFLDTYVANTQAKSDTFVNTNGNKSKSNKNKNESHNQIEKELQKAKKYKLNLKIGIALCL
jgi:hypothetical protein